MKDFDQVREERRQADRSFKIGGETFVRKVGVRPEVLAEYEKLEETTAATETLELIDGIVVDLIEDADGGHDRYRALRQREEDPLSLADMQEMVQWLVEEETGRPTQPPSPSTRGPGGTVTTLTGDSS